MKSKSTNRSFEGRKGNTYQMSDTSIKSVVYFVGGFILAIVTTHILLHL